MRRTGQIRAVLTCLICLVSPELRGQTIWTRYNLPSGNLAVDLPTDIFSVDAGPSKTALGRIFRTPDARADLTVYSVVNTAGETPAAFLLRKFKPPADVQITYRRLSRTILAISGYHGSTIWYARCNFSGVRVRCVAIDYPASEKLQWDSVVTRISNSLS